MNFVMARHSPVKKMFHIRSRKQWGRGFDKFGLQALPSLTLPLSPQVPPFLPSCPSCLRPPINSLQWRRQHLAREDTNTKTLRLRRGLGEEWGGGGGMPPQPIRVSRVAAQALIRGPGRGGNFLRRFIKITDCMSCASFNIMSD